MPADREKETQQTLIATIKNEWEEVKKLWREDKEAFAEFAKRNPDKGEKIAASRKLIEKIEANMAAREANMAEIEALLARLPKRERS